MERNLELQEQRANSIVESMQSFQKPDIETQISTSEILKIEYLSHELINIISEFKQSIGH